MNDEILFAREDEMEALNLDDAVDSQKYLIFMAGHLKLGVVAEDVVEILNNQVITYLPMVPDFIRGIINMRGQMIPILDIRARLGMEPQEGDDLVVVINLGDVQLGILVDGVDQMLDIPKNNIHPLPANSTQLLVSGMCSLPDGSGTMMVLDCEQLMPNE
ncbi:MAG: purine-binding chemotaxis protein CheW [Oscillospiraceae bacterium]|nr:purine-binding chemotaxis protein CheW [Oscillospiraceae bacterium]MCI8806569.1 purine-binding chemotaxis protein CheW [Oscillospiraceae bacterium]MCI9547908.1 purine-binding chemotaxis protein CheW [Oscillospiraceae bacterium]